MAGHGCIVFTHDLDFGTILAASHGSKPSVVQVRARNVTPEAIGQQIITALRQMASELDDSALLTIDASLRCSGCSE